MRQAHIFLLLIRFPLLKLASNSFYLPRASWARGKRRKRCRPKDAASVVHATSAFRRRAAYGNRTRLLGLGSRCTTDVLMPQFRCKITTFFSYMQKKRQNTCFSHNEHVYIYCFAHARERVCVYRCARLTKNTYICDLRRSLYNCDIPPKIRKMQKITQKFAYVKNL